MRRTLARCMLLVAAIAVLPACTVDSSARNGGPRRYEDLVTLFTAWREFQRPGLRDGVPDYTPAAMRLQQRELPSWQRRLAALDTTGWTVPQQVDYHLVRAEMNGLDFDHRVLQPWTRNPAFYVTVFASQSDQPAREGPHAWGNLETWQHQFPLSPEAAGRMQDALRIIPSLLEQAQHNLTGNAKDLWTLSVRSVQGQARALAALAGRVSEHAALSAEVQRAREATARFIAWIEAQAPSRTGPSGVGIENYDWYLRNVHLLPHTWEQQEAWMRRELGRSLAALKLEEQRNRGLPPHVPITDPRQWDRRVAAAVTEYLAFLRNREVVTIREYMEPALRARQGTLSPGPREFFNEVSHRDPIVMRTHDYHWIDLARMVHEPHPSPIRRGPLLYNLFDSRTEGLATAMEEMMMHAGFLDRHPRGRELIYVLVAQRAARALGDLMMHANRFTLEQAAEFAVSQTPRNWLRLDGNTVWGEQHLYLQQPTYGTSYLSGKMEIERLLAERATQLGDRFTLRRFMDEMNDAGLIPMSLIRWEMTGQAGEIVELAGTTP